MTLGYEWRIARRFENLEQRRRRQRDRSRGSPPESAMPDPAVEPSFDEIIDAENLNDCFKSMRSKAGQAPGPDRATFHNMNFAEWAAVLRDVSQTLGDGTYRPGESRDQEIFKIGGGTRPLTIRNSVDRVVSKTVNKAVSGYLDSIFSDASYAYRPKRSILTLFAALERTMFQQQCFILTQDDIHRAFPSVTVADCIADYRRHFTDERTFSLVERIVRGYEGTSRVIGIDQGDALSGTTLNLRLHYLLDVPSQLETPGYPHYFRYSDNLVYLTFDRPDGDQAIQRTRERLQTSGLSLKDEDGPPKDLRTEPAEVLGLQISVEGDRVRYMPGHQAQQKLRMALERTWDCPKPNRTAKEVMCGWVGSLGMAVESVGASTVAQMAMQEAAIVGHSEVGSVWEVLMGRAEEARLGWLRVRDRVATVSQPGTDLQSCPDASDTTALPF